MPRELLPAPEPRRPGPTERQRPAAPSASAQPLSGKDPPRPSSSNPGRARDTRGRHRFAPAVFWGGFPSAELRPAGTQRSGVEASERRESAEKTPGAAAPPAPVAPQPVTAQRGPPGATHACLRAISRCMGVAILTPGPEVSCRGERREWWRPRGVPGYAALWARCRRRRESPPEP